MEPFKTDIDMIRKRAQEKMTEGAVTAGYRGDREKVIDVLNDALATEIVCSLRYRNHYFMASGLKHKPIAAEFLEHANQEQAHADQIATRITQLGGTPNYNPEGLAARAHAEYAEGRSLREMIQQDLVAERVAVQLYGEMVRWLGSYDPTSRRVIEGILAEEERHADELAALVDEMPS